MSETKLNDSNTSDSLLPAEDDVKFPPLPEPRDVDFDEDISEDERHFYKTKFLDLNLITSYRLHCTACDRHLGCSASNDVRMRSHPLLRTLVCNTCYAFYNSGEFEKGDDGSELYCRWCGQGGQVYCCSDCPHVFCAKCIKRNLGIPKIKEIENTDDWKCFKCNNKSLWDLRAACWALMRYCDLKNRITMATQDPILKEKFQAICARDYSECCKNKKRRDKLESKKREEKKEAETSTKKEADSSAKKAADSSAKKAAAVISKIPPTIQVKKFASINLDEAKPEKKGMKRSMSPNKNKAVFLKTPIAVGSNPKTYGGVNLASMPKKMRMSSSPIINPVRFMNDRKSIPPPIRIRPKGPQLPIPIMTPFNGFNNNAPYTNFINDNINLSLESLTQGLDMSAVAAMSNNGADDDVVCTPDFPLEPLCEVTEDNTDDDVQCITPAPRTLPKISNPPPLVPRTANTLPDISPENIIQMTENDVTVNAQTGGLKFRVDPQTLSANKMYRLPDGRIFAINANPNMPGGYSATIVAVTETNKTAPKGATYAAKLSAVPPQATTPVPKPVRTPVSRAASAKRATPNPKTVKVTRGTETVSRDCDLDVPVEWYRYNLIDAVDALEYSISRLNKLKRDATTVHLRTRTVSEMRTLHRTLDRLLNTSTTRFNEIRDNLNKGLKQYLLKKTGGGSGANNANTANNISDDDDDDDVEILPNTEDDPIFIDENSVDSNANDTNSIDQQEVDLTGAMSSSELNDSGDKSVDMDENFLKTNEEINEKSGEDETSKVSQEVDPLANIESDHTNENNNVNMENGPNAASKATDNLNNILNESSNDICKINDDYHEKDMKNDTKSEKSNVESGTLKAPEEEKEKEEALNESNLKSPEDKEEKDKALNGEEDHIMDILKDSEKKEDRPSKTKTDDKQENKIDEIADNVDKNDDKEIEDKSQDAEMSEEMIETLLKDDDGVDEDDTPATNTDSMDIADVADSNEQPTKSIEIAESV